METHAHSTEDHGRVNDTLITRFLGICIGIGIAAAILSLHYVLGWHWAACSCICGAVGATMGAMGTSVHGPNNAAILAYSGITVFIAGFLTFLGILQMFLR
ncbi:MAG: hypothetical protein SGJ05_02685 [bacterium]|nr:hypothetical protein [bacterium]